MASKELSYAYGYVFFVTNVVAAMIVWFYLYESRMLSLENVELMYGEEGLTPQTSDSWVPPRYLTRRQRDPRFSRHNSLAYPQGHFRLARRSIL
jgi:SP family sugar:H+ symporter-like MFS transporter